LPSSSGDALRKEGEEGKGEKRRRAVVTRREVKRVCCI